MATVTCHTEDCPNAGHAIDLNLEYVDDETGEIRTVDSVSCGTCGQQITDIA